VVVAAFVAVGTSFALDTDVIMRIEASTEQKKWDGFEARMVQIGEKLH